MMIMALDASSTNVGFAIAEDDRLIAGNEKKYSKGPFPDRLCKIRDDVSFLCRRYHVDILAVETPVYIPRGRGNGGAASYSILCQVVGVLRALAHDRGMQFVEVNPVEAKSAMGNPKAGKRQMVALAEMQFGKVRGEHNADAIGVWLAALGKLRIERVDRESEGRG